MKSILETLDAIKGAKMSNDSEVPYTDTTKVNETLRQIPRDNKIVEIHKVLFEGLDVRRTILHQGVPLPNGGDTTTSMYSEVGQTGVGKSTGRSGVKMKYNQDGLFCEYKGHAFVIPLANVVVVYL